MLQAHFFVGYLSRKRLNLSKVCWQVFSLHHVAYVGVSLLATCHKKKRGISLSVTYQTRENWGMRMRERGTRGGGRMLCSF
jgi:hypothetical protein